MSSPVPYDIDPNFIYQIDIEKNLDELLRFHINIYVEQQLYPTKPFDPFGKIADELFYAVKWRGFKDKICISKDNNEQQNIEMKLLYDKLILDKYINTDKNNYVVTAEGMLLIKNENGYTGRSKTKGLKAIERDLQVKQTLNLTLILAIGTSIAGLYYLIEILKLFCCQ